MDLNEKYEELVTDPLKFRSINSVNHKPHPYMVGSTHLSRNDSMFLGDGQIREMERKHGPMCYWKGEDGKTGTRCTLPYDAHTADTVMFIQLTRNASEDEARAVLMVVSEECEKDGIDGFTFVETEEQFRIGDAHE